MIIRAKRLLFLRQEIGSRNVFVIQATINTFRKLKKCISGWLPFKKPVFINFAKY